MAAQFVDARQFSASLELPQWNGMQHRQARPQAIAFRNSSSGLGGLHARSSSKRLTVCRD